jgi:hypothetical protein
MEAMNRKLALILSYLIITIATLSCGGWRDNIKLSRRSAEFKPTGDSIIITTKGHFWWLDAISVYDTTYYQFEGTDVLTEHYKFAKDCFVFEKINNTTLFISLDTNNLGIKRLLRIDLQAGDYFDFITIVQNSL